MVQPINLFLNDNFNSFIMPTMGQMMETTPATMNNNQILFKEIPLKRKSECIDDIITPTKYSCTDNDANDSSYIEAQQELYSAGDETSNESTGGDGDGDDNESNATTTSNSTSTMRKKRKIRTYKQPNQHPVQFITSYNDQPNKTDTARIEYQKEYNKKFREEYLSYQKEYNQKNREKKLKRVLERQQEMIRELGGAEYVYCECYRRIKCFNMKHHLKHEIHYKQLEKNKHTFTRKLKEFRLRFAQMKKIVTSDGIVFYIDPNEQQPTTQSNTTKLTSQEEEDQYTFQPENLTFDDCDNNEMTSTKLNHLEDDQYTFEPENLIFDNNEISSTKLTSQEKEEEDQYTFEPENLIFDDKEISSTKLLPFDEYEYNQLKYF